MSWLNTRIHIERRVLRTLILMLILFSSLIIGIEDLVRGVESVFLWTLVLMGMFLGWWLASIKIAGWKAALFSSVLGTGVTIVFVGRLGLKLAYLLQAFFQWLTQGVRWLIKQTDYVDSSVLLALFQDLSRDISIIFLRLAEWVTNIFLQQPSFDPVAIGFVWGLAILSVAIQLPEVVPCYSFVLYCLMKFETGSSPFIFFSYWP